MAERRSLSKDLYEAAKRLRQIHTDHHNGVYEEQSVTRDNVQKLRSSARDLTAWLDPGRSAIEPDTVRIITITQRGRMWFATSEDEPPIFVAAHSREGVEVALGAILKGEVKTNSV
jgi:hypothetical protein